MELSSIVSAFGLEINKIKIAPFGSGLINETFLINSDKNYILQKINTTIFKNPEIIAQNISACFDFLSKKHPDYIFINPLLTLNKEHYAYGKNQSTWRLLPFITNSFTVDQTESNQQAYEAAKAVGAFSAKLNGIDIKNLMVSIPHFHDLSFRYLQFEESRIIGNQKRIEACSEIINKFIQFNHLITTYEEITVNPDFPLRVQHHDTKINNVLFDKQTHKSVCLCDLDTVMPGYFISDLGDMMRTYLSPVNEESTQFDEVIVRMDYFVAVVTGYLSEMKNVLTATEKKYIFYAGEFMIYMQGLRFLTDYLNNDQYYATQYENQNLNRTLNQLKLLQEYQSKKQLMESIIQSQL